MRVQPLRNQDEDEMTADARPTEGRPREVVVLRRDLGDFGSPAPRPVRRRTALTVARPLLRPLTVTFCAQTTDRVLSLTYDDGPDPAQTPALLDLLAERGVHATFFVLADAANAHPALVRRIVAEGHELALHGADHTRLSGLPDAEAVARVADAKRRVEEVAAVPVRLFRPPYGAHTPGALRGWRRLGLDVVIWSAWATDWDDDTVQAVADRAVSAVHPGGILLLHDTRGDPETLEPGKRLPQFSRAAVSQRLLDALAAGDWTFATTGELLARYPRVRAVIRELWT